MKCPKCKKKMAGFHDDEGVFAVCCRNKSCWFYGIKRWHTTEEVNKKNKDKL